MSRRLNRYGRLIEHVFEKNHERRASRVPFTREDVVKAARRLEIKLPKNLGDVIYSFRYRTELPPSVQARAPKGKTWVIRPAGPARYAFEAVTVAWITPRADLTAIDVPDATPGIIARYALTDEQALLARLRYNRLLDIFTGVTCYSLQNHLRTAIPDLGQVETDELYVGIDRQGAHHVLPVQAKGGSDRLSIVQIEQDFALCAHKFPTLHSRPIGAQFMDDDVIALFEFSRKPSGVVLVEERHYRLVTAGEAGGEAGIQSTRPKTRKRR